VARRRRARNANHAQRGAGATGRRRSHLVRRVHRVGAAQRVSRVATITSTLRLVQVPVLCAPVALRPPVGPPPPPAPLVGCVLRDLDVTALLLPRPAQLARRVARVKPVARRVVQTTLTPARDRQHAPHAAVARSRAVGRQLHASSASRASPAITAMDPVR
jgi:hypothetical protein